MNDSLMNPRLKIFLILAAIALTPVFLRCAHPVSPTGGPKDVTPPMVESCEPENFTPNFGEKKIVLEFDEYIVLKDPAKEIFTSPPMVTRPEYTVRGRSLLVEFREELRENATYVIFFGNAITDLTEGNPLKGYSYVFSTGPVIDSMLVAGSVVSAFDHIPAENIVVSVYSADQDTIPLDSMPRKVPPLSAIRTNADGSFMLNNLPDKEFLLFALEDLNNNFYYDLPEEKIAFLDSLIRPEWVPTLTDTSEVDSLENMTIIETTEPKYIYNLFLFKEADSLQRLLGSSITPQGSIQLAFRMPAVGLIIEPLNFPAGENWMMEEYSVNKDTLLLWPKDPERDTFKLRVSIPLVIEDTLRLVRKKTDTGTSRRKNVVAKNLEYRTSAKGGILEPQKEFVLNFSEPVKSSDLSGIQLIDNPDTLLVPTHFTDSIRRKLIVEYNWLENKSYTLSIPDSVLTGMSGKMNNAIVQTFRTKPYSDYGTLIMHYVIPTGNHSFIVELMGEKDMVIQRDTLVTSGKIAYTFLKAGPCRIKAISDRNGNSRWDTGNYDLKQLPEAVIYFQKEISVRSNWEIQEEWNLEP
jgi:hypothetical protein